MATAPFANPIGWAQFRLLGGWKNLLLTAGAYAVILMAAMLGMVQSVRAPASTTFGYFIGIFLGMQVLVLILYGTLRVSGSVRTDVTTRVIESHRLMPVPPLNAVLGYLLGSTIQALALFAINFVLGAVAVAGAGIVLQSWAFSNAVILGFSLFLWTIVMFFSFRSALAGVGLIGALVMMLMGGWMLLVLVPGLNVLVSPLIGRTIFDMSAGRAGDSVFVIAAMFQLAIGLLYVMAASRRYKSDDAVGFGQVLGLLLLVAWTAACAVGLSYEQVLSPLRASPELGHEAAFITSLTLVLLMAMLPVSSAARLVDAVTETTGARGRPMLVVLLASVIATAMPYGLPTAHSMLFVRTWVVMAAFLAGIRYVLGIAHRLAWRPRVTVITWLVASWGVPLLIEIIRSASSVDPDGHMSQVGMSWAPGELFQIWSQDRHVHSKGFAGLAVQIATALLLCVVYHLLQKRKEDQE